MRILLLRPPMAIEKFHFPHPTREPLGLEYLASFIENKHEVVLLDSIAESWNNFWEIKEIPNMIFQGLKPAEITSHINKFKPDLIGLSWLFSTQNNSIKILIETIKKFNNNLPIIVGGAQPSSNPREILSKYSEIDFVTYGEGEYTLLELLDNRLNNLEQIKGLAFRQKNKIIVNQPRDLISNLDILPIPKRNRALYQNYSKQYLYNYLYNKLDKIITNKQSINKLSAKVSALPFLDQTYFRSYNKKNKDKLPFADIITSRGCPNHCTFCAIHNIWGHIWRKRSANNVLNEIDTLVNQFGIKHINFQDDNFNLSPERVIEICRGIVKNNYQITLSAPSGTYLPAINNEVLYWLKKAGMNSLRFSIESGNQVVLNDIIKKNINLKSVKNIIDQCKNLGLYTEGAFIFGIPGETKKTMQETMDYAKSIGFDRVVKFIYQPFPNTELYKICQEKGYLTGDFDLEKSYVTSNNCFVCTPEFSPDDVIKIAR